MKNPRNLDKFYTKKNVVLKCLKSIIKDMGRSDLIIDPSAGDGAFSSVIKSDNLISMDLHPEGRGIMKIDWFNYVIPSKYQNVSVVGNPPFGKSNKVSKNFIRHAISFPNVKTVAFILPNVYKKYTHQCILGDEWRIKEILDIGENAFLLDGADYHVPCSFFVFSKSKGKDLRFRPERYTESVHFKWGAPGDFDVFMFGAAPKKLTKQPTSNNRGYYIKSKIGVDELIGKIRGMEWSGNSSASGGVYWLTKPEIICQYNSRYGN